MSKIKYWELELKYELWLRKWHQAGFERLWSLMNNDATLNFDFASFFKASTNAYTNDEMIK